MPLTLLKWSMKDAQAKANELLALVGLQENASRCVTRFANGFASRSIHRCGLVTKSGATVAAKRFRNQEKRHRVTKEIEGNFMSKQRIQTASGWIAGSLVLAGLLMMIETSLAQNKGEQATESPVKSSVAPKKAHASGDLHLEKSRVYAHVGKMGLGHEHGIVGQLKEGTIHLAGKQAGGTLVFDMTTFDADGDAARKYVGLEGSIDPATRTKVNASLLGEGVLHTTKFPTATFDIRSIKKI
jgi:polyisoprenoid-binding protein YceI